MYGADAVSGAVNVITRRDFEGVELAATYGQALDQSDATRQSYEITLGSNLADNRGNVAVSLGYTKVDPVRQDARTLGMFSLSSTNGAVQGSGTATPVTFNNLVPGQLDTTTGAIVPIYNTYNFQPQNYYQTALDRYQGTAIGHYNVTDRVEVYANLMYSRSDVDSQLRLAARSSTTLRFRSATRSCRPRRGNRYARPRLSRRRIACSAVQQR